MKKVLKSSLSLVLALTIVLSSALVRLGEIDFGGLFTVKAEAASVDDLVFKLNYDGESYYVSYCDEDASGELVIPSKYNGLPVTRIGYLAFEYRFSLTSITIPDSVTSINDEAFCGCSRLTTITIPDSVTSIGVDAFLGTAYYNDESNWVDGVLYIGNHLIEAKNTVNGDYIIKDGTKTIADEAFYECTSLTSITIPDSVTSIGDDAFYNCTGLSTITIPNSVTSIGWSAFENCTSLTVVKIGNSVTSIGEKAFYNCTSLTLVKIGNSVTSIGEKTFYNCTSLTLITIPDSVTSICYRAFYNCTSLTSVKIGNGVTSIGGDAFYDCTSLTSITIPNSVTSIGSHAFRNCTSLTSITIPDSVTSIGSHAFRNCTSLTSITIPDSVTSIGECVFFDCSNLTSIIIPDSVTSIGECAFFDCSNLTSIIIPDSVTSIGNFAFYNCSSLKDVYYRGLLSDWDKIVIGSDNDCLINANISHRCTYGDWEVNVEPTCTGDGMRSRTCVVCGEVISETIIANGHNYLVTNTLSSHPHTITYTCSYCGDEKTEASVSSSCVECNFTITPIDSSSYKLVSYIGTETEVLIPATYNERAITTISVGCFKGNTEITSVEVGDNVTNIGSLAFMNCSSLEKVIIPASVTSIGTQAFYGFTGTICCVKGSYAYEYAIANGIKYEILGAEEPIQDTDNTTVDYDNSLIYTTVENCSNINEILGLSDSANVIAKASYIYGNTELYGTGTIITVFDGNKYIGDFTLVVSGDINGDSVCDVLDCYMSELAANGHTTLAGVYEMAADSNSDGKVDANDYQAIVNKAVL